MAGIGTIVLDVRYHPSRRVRQAAAATLLALVHTSSANQRLLMKAHPHAVYVNDESTVYCTAHHVL